MPQRVVDEISGNGGRAVAAVQGDVSKRDGIDRLFNEAVKQFGTVYILVNNVGVYQLGRSRK